MADDRGIQLKVQGEDLDIRFERGSNVLDERDPNNLNSHLRVAFDEVFGEPDPGLHSFGKVWRLSDQVFTAVKLWIYRILTLICALPLMIIWGCYFAVVSFLAIWCCAPCFRACQLQMHCMKKYWSAWVHAIYGPCFEAFGLIFSKVRVEKVQAQARA